MNDHKTAAPRELIEIAQALTVYLCEGSLPQGEERAEVLSLCREALEKYDHQPSESGAQNCQADNLN